MRAQISRQRQFFIQSTRAYWFDVVLTRLTSTDQQVEQAWAYAMCCTSAGDAMEDDDIDDPYEPLQAHMPGPLPEKPFRLRMPTKKAPIKVFSRFLLAACEKFQEDCYVQCSQLATP